MLPRALRMYSRDKREEALVQIIRRWGTVDPQMKEEVGFAIFFKNLNSLQAEEPGHL